MMAESRFKSSLNSIYRTGRVTFIIFQNLSVVFCYLILNWVFLIPLIQLSRTQSLYNRIENTLYNWLLYTVASWSWSGSVKVHECGESLEDLIKDGEKNGKKPRVLLLCNHQNFGDVPLLMHYFVPHPECVKLWVMARLFKYTHFGMVSQTHQDYFIRHKNHSKGDLHKFCLHLKDPQKNCFILFPEGGFRNALQKSSDGFAEKNQLPILKNVIWPRVGAFEELIEPDIGITHIASVTMIYEDVEKPLHLFDLVLGHRTEDVFIHFKFWEIKDEGDVEKNGPNTIKSSYKKPNENLIQKKDDYCEKIKTYELVERRQLNENFLRKIWIDKDELMEKFYRSRDSFFKENTYFGPVELNMLHILGIQAFYWFFLAIFAYYLYNW